VCCSLLVVFRSPARISGLAFGFTSASSACICRRRHAGGHLFSRWVATIVARPGWQVKQRDLGYQRHAPALPQFALDSFPEQFVREPSLPALEFGDGLILLTVPVIADRQPKDASALDWIAAQDRCPVQTMITLMIYLPALLQTLILLNVG
jgi:hypothetical protein